MGGIQQVGSFSYLEFEKTLWSVAKGKSAKISINQSLTRTMTRTTEETLKEAERSTRKGITINTFMLDDSPVLKGFVDKMTRINRGRAFYTTPDRLGEYLLVDYVAHRRKKI